MIAIALIAIGAAVLAAVLLDETGYGTDESSFYLHPSFERGQYATQQNAEQNSATGGGLGGVGDAVHGEMVR